MLVTASLFLNGCSRQPEDVAAGLTGRWQRAGPLDLVEPDLLIAGHLEFREDGQVAVLLSDAGPETFWTVGLGRYTLPDRASVKLQGRCWQGYESFDCTRVYRVMIDGDTLHLSSEDGVRSVIYRRIGKTGQALPPTLAPPVPTSAPN